jgi:hypothetical protein
VYPRKQIADCRDVPFPALAGLDTAGVQRVRQRAQRLVAVQSKCCDDRGQRVGEAVGVGGDGLAQRAAVIAAAAQCGSAVGVRMRRNRGIARSRRLNGRCEFSARLFAHGPFPAERLRRFPSGQHHMTEACQWR